MNNVRVPRGICEDWTIKMYRGREWRKYSQSGYASFVTSAKAAIPTHYILVTERHCTNVHVRTRDTATRMIKQNLGAKLACLQD
jgi:hypothetical protein